MNEENSEIWQKSLQSVTRTVPSAGWSKSSRWPEVIHIAYDWFTSHVFLDLTNFLRLKTSAAEIPSVTSQRSHALWGAGAQLRQPQATQSSRKNLMAIWGQLPQMWATPRHYHTQNLFNKSGHGSATMWVSARSCFSLSQKRNIKHEAAAQHAMVYM